MTLKLEWPSPPQKATPIAGVFVGGVAVGLLVCVIVAWALCKEIKRLRAIVGRNKSDEAYEPSFANEESEKTKDWDFPSARGGPFSGVESEPLLAGQVLFEVEEVVRSNILLRGPELIFKQGNI
jgi:hypothetical protein